MQFNNYATVPNSIQEQIMEKYQGKVNI